MPTTSKPKQPRPIDMDMMEHGERDSGTTVWIERRMPVAPVHIGHDGDSPIEAAVLGEIAAFLDRENEPGDHINDQFEFRYQGHVVEVRLGDAVEDR